MLYRRYSTPAFAEILKISNKTFKGTAFSGFNRMALATQTFRATLKYGLPVSHSSHPTMEVGVYRTINMRSEQVRRKQYGEMATIFTMGQGLGCYPLAVRRYSPLCAIWLIESYFYPEGTFAVKELKKSLTDLFPAVRRYCLDSVFPQVEYSVSEAFNYVL